MISPTQLAPTTRQRIRGGDFLDPAMAHALCKSVCMLLIYTPNYFNTTHLYCAREYRAMLLLETERLRQLKKPLSTECGLIIPLVLRGVDSLPKEIRLNRAFYDFEHFSLTSRELAKNRQFEDIIRKIARAIFDRHNLLTPISDQLTCDCDNFAFPSDADVLPWVQMTVAPATPFPFRAS